MPVIKNNGSASGIVTDKELVGIADWHDILRTCLFGTGFEVIQPYTGICPVTKHLLPNQSLLLVVRSFIILVFFKRGT